MYVRFTKDALKKKTNFIEEEESGLEVGCSAIIQKKLPLKSEDPESFNIAVTIREAFVSKELLDLGASINLMPLAIMN